jgi:hypothetical protein
MRCALCASAPQRAAAGGAATIARRWVPRRAALCAREASRRLLLPVPPACARIPFSHGIPRSRAIDLEAGPSPGVVPARIKERPVLVRRRCFPFASGERQDRFYRPPGTNARTT